MNITQEELQQIIEEELEAVLNEKCQKGYKTHPTRKTKEMFGKTYRNCVKAEEGLEAVLNEFEEKDNTPPTDPEEYRKWACRMAAEPENRPEGIKQSKMIAVCKGEGVSEAKSYHWDEPDWHYNGGYGDAEGRDSKW